MVAQCDSMAEDTALRLSTPNSPVQGGRGGTLGRLGDTRGNLGSGGRGMQGGGVAGGSVLRHIPASSQLTRHRRAPVAGGSSLTKGVLPLSGPFNVDRRRRTPLSIARIVIRFSPTPQHWRVGAVRRQAEVSEFQEGVQGRVPEEGRAVWPLKRLCRADPPLNRGARAVVRECKINASAQ